MTTPAIPPEPPQLTGQTTVSYTVREILDKQTNLLLGIDHKVDSKADKADLVDLVHEVKGHGERLISLEESRVFNRKLWAGIGVVLMVTATVIGGLFGGHVI